MLTSLRLRQLDKQLADAQSYVEWKDLADEHDRVSGKLRWRQIDQTPLYDFNSIRGRLDRLRQLHARHDDVGLLFTLNEGIHGNMGGMGNSNLYHEAKGGTKKLIEDYVEEIVLALRHLAELESEHITTADKLDFFYRANHCYGRSALMLSGGGILGFYHLGVVKTLLEQNNRARVQKHGTDWPRFSGVVNSVHSLLDQTYTGDINIVPGFRWYNPAKLLSHITEEELMELMEEGERSAWAQLTAIDTCTRISRALDDILERFERGDLKPVRAARRRPKRPAARTAKKPLKKSRAKARPLLVNAA